MADFCQVLMIFMEFINIGPVYTRGCMGGAQGGISGGKSLKKKQDDTNSRV